jgi:hypothetical protein
MGIGHAVPYALIHRVAHAKHSDRVIETAPTLGLANGGQLRSRNPDTQKTDALLACNILHCMLDVGRPRDGAIRERNAPQAH